jgi:hypothetical protein
MRYYSRQLLRYQDVAMFVKLPALHLSIGIHPPFTFEKSRSSNSDYDNILYGMAQTKARKLLGKLAGGQHTPR